ncbi:unnamed protein product [Discosporangium mesarthrocarpum]
MARISNLLLRTNLMLLLLLPLNGFVFNTCRQWSRCRWGPNGFWNLPLNEGTAPVRSCKGAVWMDDEIAREGIKEELTTRDAYLETRFTKLSESGHDLTPMTTQEVENDFSASGLSAAQKSLLLGTGEVPGGGLMGDTDERFYNHRYDHQDDLNYNFLQSLRERKRVGMYACVIGGLPLFTSGCRLPPLPGDICLSFFEPCDPEHVLEDGEGRGRGRGGTGSGGSPVFCSRSGVQVGDVLIDSASPTGKRYRVLSSALEFHPLGRPLPVRCQPENYWGTEGQYRVWQFKRQPH